MDNRWLGKQRTVAHPCVYYNRISLNLKEWPNNLSLQDLHTPITQMKAFPRSHDRLSERIQMSRLDQNTSFTRDTSLHRQWGSVVNPSLNKNSQSEVGMVTGSRWCYQETLGLHEHVVYVRARKTVDDIFLSYFMYSPTSSLFTRSYAPVHPASASICVLVG